MQEQVTQQPFNQWAIVELMGHVRLAGRVTEEKRFGVEMGRIDIPGDEGSFVTQYFGGGSVYRITPTTEEVAREMAKKKTAPIQPWELQALCPPREERPIPSPITYDGADEDYEDSDPYLDD